MRSVDAPQSRPRFRPGSAPRLEPFFCRSLPRPRHFFGQIIFMSPPRPPIPDRARSRLSSGSRSIRRVRCGRVAMRIIRPRPIIALAAIALILVRLSFGRLLRRSSSETKTLQAGRDRTRRQPVEGPEFHGVPPADRRHRQAQGPRRARQAGGGRISSGPDRRRQGHRSCKDVPASTTWCARSDLDNPNTEGWDILGVRGGCRPAIPSPERKGVICAPGEPKLDGAAAAARSATRPAPRRRSGTTRIRHPALKCAADLR